MVGNLHRPETFSSHPQQANPKLCDATRDGEPVGLSLAVRRGPTGVTSFDCSDQRRFDVREWCVGRCLGDFGDDAMLDFPVQQRS